MRVTFHSNHLTTAATDGELLVRIALVGDDGQVAKSDEVSFSVPAGFHVHNDLVATALLTLVGRSQKRVEFNFGISTRCAERLATLYSLHEIGPVDRTMEPRQPGRFLGLNFSGGVDSTTAWVLLRELLGDEFKVLTSQYWGDRHREVAAAREFQPDIICATNLRALGYNLLGRFNNAVPLLFADYLDLSGICTGHGYIHYPFSHESLRGGQAPAFLQSDYSFAAGGLEEVHLVRGISEPGIARLLTTLAPQFVHRAIRASAPYGSDKLAARMLMFRWAYESAGKPLSTFLRALPDVYPRWHEEQVVLQPRALWIERWFGVEAAALVNPRIREVDPALLAPLEHRWAERYHPNMLPLVPVNLRDRLLTLLHRAGIYPFDERDYVDLDRTRQLLESFGTLSFRPWSPQAPPAA